MPSAVDICNMALGHIGSRAQITSISPPDGSVEAGHCARYYPIARREALERGAWSWAKTRVVLSPVANPSDVWLYAYAVPSDCLQPLRVLPVAFVPSAEGVVATTIAATEDEGADFEIENGVLLTNAPEAVLLYKRDVTDTTKFSTSFAACVSYLISAYLAGPVLKADVGAKAASDLRRVAASVLSEAATQDANGSSARADSHIPSHLRVR